MNQASPGKITAEVIVKGIQERKPLGPFHNLIIEGDVLLDFCNYFLPLEFQGCTFKGRFNAAGTIFAKSLTLAQCVFEQHANFEGAQVTGNLHLTGSTFGVADKPGGATTGQLARISGHLQLDGVQVHGELDFNGCKVEGNLDLQGAMIGGDLRLNLAQVGNCLFANSLETGAEPIPLRVRQSGYFQGIKVQGAAIFQNAAITGSLNCFGAELRSGLHCDGAQLGENLDLTTAAIRGNATFNQAKVGKVLNLYDARVEGNLLGANVEVGSAGETGGDLSLASAEVTGEVHLHGAHIHGDLQMSSVELPGGFYAYPSDRRTVIDGDLLFTAAHVGGAINVSGARIGGTFSLAGAQVQGDLRCQQYPLQGRDQPTEIGQAYWFGANLTGSIFLHGTHIRGEFNFETAKVRGSMECRAVEELPTRFDGQAVLSSLEISGDIYFTQVRFGKALHMVSARIGGNLFFMDCQLGAADAADKDEDHGSARLALLRVAGVVLVQDSHILGNLNLDGADISVAFECALRERDQAPIDGNLGLSYARIHSVEIDGRIGPKGTVKLNMAQIGALKFDERLPKALDLEGLQFQTLTVPKNGATRNYLGLVQASEPFDRVTYLGMERWLKNRGEEDAANRVYMDMRRRQRQEMTRGLTPLSPRWLLRWFGRIMNLAWDSFIYLAVKAATVIVLYFLVVLVATALLFVDPESVTRKEVAPAPGTKTAQQKADGDPGRWNVTKAVAMSVQINLPLIPIRTVEDWRPSNKALPVLESSQFTYSDYAELVGMVSSLAIAFLAGGISNKLSRRKAIEN